MSAVRCATETPVPGRAGEPTPAEGTKVGLDLSELLAPDLSMGTLPTLPGCQDIVHISEIMDTQAL